MKKSILLVLISFSLLINSCKKDDDAGVESNNITFGDTRYDLAYGLSEDYGLHSEGVYNMDITLSDNNGADSKGIYFELFSSTPNKLAPGTYTLSNNNNALSFSSSSEYFDDSDGTFSSLVSGTVTIINSEIDYYELTFRCDDASGQTYTGRFFGNVVYDDEP